MHNYQQLLFWQRARELNKSIYQISATFPTHENYSLTSQMRRASISISSNIAEGAGYSSDAQFARFLNIALGSACEVESQLFLAIDLHYVAQDDCQSVFDEILAIKKMIVVFLKKITKYN